MPDAEGFLEKIVKDLSSDFGPVIGDRLRELVQKTITENSGQIQALLDNLIKDISYKYKIDFKAADGLHIKVVRDGIKIDADFIISVKKKQNGQEVEVASMRIPLHPEETKVAPLLVKISKTNLNIRHE